MKVLAAKIQTIGEKMNVNDSKLKTTGIKSRTSGIRLRTHAVRTRSTGVGWSIHVHFDAGSSYLNIENKQMVVAPISVVSGLQPGIHRLVHHGLANCQPEGLTHHNDGHRPSIQHKHNITRGITPGN